MESEGEILFQREIFRLIDVRTIERCILSSKKDFADEYFPGWNEYSRVEIRMALISIKVRFWGYALLALSIVFHNDETV